MRFAQIQYRYVYIVHNKHITVLYFDTFRAILPSEVIKVPTARTRANRKYNEKAYDRIEFTVKKGQKAVIIAAAQAAGMSTNAFIKEALAEKMQKMQKTE